MLNEEKIGIACVLGDVGGFAGDEVVDAEDTMTLREQPVAKVRTEKAGATGDNRVKHVQEYWNGGMLENVALMQSS
ncbi:MAG: hypothetical protein HBSIN02_24240 [Bacteroidia bacterium]|nr:MAG: hypothetical protein HBSIN02_24240 [Bacteroidia bacterium]